MGFFSWKTQDTNKSISNVHSSRGSFPVTMTDDKGNRWHEHYYDGYGDFGGKDYYELLAEMNGKTTRDEGIDLQYGIRGVENVKTGKRFVHRIDFLNFRDDILLDGLSANQLIVKEDWNYFNELPENVKFPNLTEDPNWEWRDSKPLDCEYQGYFY